MSFKYFHDITIYHRVITIKKKQQQQKGTDEYDVHHDINSNNSVQNAIVLL